jgi:hypothetical protein
MALMGVVIGIELPLIAAAHGNRERDFSAVQEFVNSKRTIPLADKDSNLSISGDVRAVWAHVAESLHGYRLRGDHGIARETPSGDVVLSDDPSDGVPFSRNEFDVELNLYVDYICDRSWLVGWLQYDNQAGVDRNSKPCSVDPENLGGSGECDNICLKKAYIGYNIYVDGCSRLDIEVGRRPMYNAFDSRLQFDSRFDGALFRYAHYLSCWGDFYNNTGFFVVDSRTNHYAYVTEFGLLDTFQTGLDLKYSFIDWESWMSHHENRCGTKDPIGSRFQVSQWTFHYNTHLDSLCMPLRFYGAFIVNHAAKPISLTNDKKYNMAGYIGIILGNVCRQGDWSIDCTFEICEPQAIPERDISGIGSRANVMGTTFTADGVGYTNFRGARFEGLYAFTDNFALDMVFEFSQQDKRKVDGKHSYSMFELQAIYAF